MKFDYYKAQITPWLLWQDVDVRAFSTTAHIRVCRNIRLE